MSLSANVSEKAALIWAIADKLTGVYKPHEYGEVILPLTVIRRFDCILADTKDAVLEKFETVKNLPMRDVLLRNASGKAFYNTSKFTFERLLDDPAFDARDALVGRMGGDEFAVFSTCPLSVEEAQCKACELIEAWGSHSASRAVELGCSVGIVRVVRGETFFDLYRAADCALYASKDNGKGCYSW